MNKKFINKILTQTWSTEDSDVVRLRKSAMTGFALFMCLGGLMWGVLCLIDNLFIPALIPFGYSLIIFPSVLLSFKYPNRYTMIANFQLALSLVLPFALQWLLGGYFHSGAVMLWAWSALMGAVLIVGPQKSLYWYLAYSGLILASTLGNEWLEQFDFGRVSLKFSVLASINIFCVTSMAYFVSRWFSQKIDTNQKLLSENIQKLKKNLDEAYQKTLQSERLANMGELAANIGHEINNPLAISTAYVNKVRTILEDNGTLTEEIDNALKKQTIANQRIKNIVQGLRVFARKESDHLELVNLSEVLSQAKDLLTEIYQKEQITLVYKNDFDNLPIKGDVGKLQQVIFNLLANAKDATQTNEYREIQLLVKKDDSNQVVIEVKDNGHGIPDEIKDKIFDPFFTTKKVGQGTGIGLGVVSQIIQKLGGKIQLKSVLNKGTVFTIQFPLLDNSEIPIQSEIKNAKFTNFNQTKKVLVVEDEEDLREVLAEYLEVYDCKVTKAGHGKEALDKMKNETFDLIFTDITMPVMDGLTFINKVFELDLVHPPQIILVTGMVSLDSFSKENQSVENKIDGILTKPYEVSDLEKVLDDLKEKFKKAS